MKLSFVYNLEDEYWNDGLKKAVDILSEKWEVRKFNRDFVNYMTDFVLVWGAFGSEQERLVAELPYPKGICVAGGPVSHPDVHKFDVVFVESDWWKQQFRKVGVNARVAFGTNTEIFYDMKLEQRPIDYLYPAAFAKWKRHEKFLLREGRKVAIGYMQPNDHERECYDICLGDPDTLVIPRVKPSVLPWLYNQSKNVYIPSTLAGGGERTVLEALSCGCHVEVESDNEKLVKLLEQAKVHVPDHMEYAQKLRSGIGEFV